MIGVVVVGGGVAGRLEGATGVVEEGGVGDGA